MRAKEANGYISDKYPVIVSEERRVSLPEFMRSDFW